MKLNSFVSGYLKNISYGIQTKPKESRSWFLHSCSFLRFRLPIKLIINMILSTTTTQPLSRLPIKQRWNWCPWKMWVPFQQLFLLHHLSLPSWGVMCRQQDGKKHDTTVHRRVKGLKKGKSFSNFPLGSSFMHACTLLDFQCELGTTLVLSWK